MQPIDRIRLSRIKPSFATRRINHNHIGGLDEHAFDLRSGDLVLARVDEVGHHTRIERPDGRRALLFPGDEILVACGARYAPDQFEADCPTAIGPAQLAAAGGVAWLTEAGHRVHAVSGCLTRSPLAMRETEAAINLPCLTPVDLYDAETVQRLTDPGVAVAYRSAA